MGLRAGRLRLRLEDRGDSRGDPGACGAALLELGATSALDPQRESPPARARMLREPGSAPARQPRDRWHTCERTGAPRGQQPDESPGAPPGTTTDVPAAYRSCTAFDTASCSPRPLKFHVEAGEDGRQSGPRPRLRGPPRTGRTLPGPQRRADPLPWTDLGLARATRPRRASRPPLTTSCACVGGHDAGAGGALLTPSSARSASC
jgi:hypothetical protein